MRVLLTGSTGLIGSALVTALEGSGHTATRLVRRSPGAGEVQWDPSAGTIDAAGLEGHDAAVHLAGEGVAEHRWTAAQKARVKGSRTAGTGLLATALAGLAQPPAVLVSGSAIGYYGARGDDVIDEEEPNGHDFLAEVCREWEAAAEPARVAGIRTAHIRTGIVLAPKGGALARQLPIFKMGAGGPLAGGSQWVSWISIDDEVRAIIHIIETESVRGPVNLTGPTPVRNREFAKALGRAVHRPALLPVPRVALWAVLGRELTSNLLASQRVVPAALQASGFEFRHPTIDAAFAAVLGGSRQ